MGPKSTNKLRTGIGYYVLYDAVKDCILETTVEQRYSVRDLNRSLSASGSYLIWVLAGSAP